MKKTLILSLALFLFTHTVFAAGAANVASEHQAKQKDIQLREELKQKIQAITDDPALKTKVMKEAQRRIILCAACHGKDGNSVVSYAPSLAGQNPVYMVDQFMRFGDGRRHDFTMSSLAKSIKDEDKIKLSIYFSEQKMKPMGGGNQALIPHGQQKYQALCAECHGSDGHGVNQGYARLAGQRPEYIVKMLKVFKNQTGKRSNPWMTARTSQLNEKDMQAIAAFLANQP